MLKMGVFPTTLKQLIFRPKSNSLSQGVGKNNLFSYIRLALTIGICLPLLMYAVLARLYVASSIPAAAFVSCASSKISSQLWVLQCIWRLRHTWFHTLASNDHGKMTHCTWMSTLLQFSLHDPTACFHLRSLLPSWIERCTQEHRKSCFCNINVLWYIKKNLSSKFLLVMSNF